MKRPTWQLQWDDGMSVGIPEIDEDHKRFLVLINELNRSITEGRKQTEIKERLVFIVEDAARHFQREEELFQEMQYPDAKSHALVHAQALQALKRIQDSFIPYGLDTEWVDAGLFIKSILLSHIFTEDMKYAVYFKSKSEDPD
jgi:hemerythrin-like metal-binding protein